MAKDLSNKTVVLGLSGGVDSAVAAILRDPTPIHWDREATRALGLEGRLLNQSPVNLGYVINMLIAWAGPTCLRRLRTEFPLPVFDGDRVVEFFEKPEAGEGWINGGFFVLTPGVFDYIEGDASIFERECVEQLALDGQLAGHRHYSFWSCMDTIKEKQLLEEIWATDKAPWKIWS